MLLNKKRLNASRLYLILDTQVLDYAHLLRVLKVAVPFGVDIVQLRDKFGAAKDILSFSRQALKITRGQIPFIVNDRVDIALASGADGVHLGQNDLSCAQARKILGSKAIIGISCQQHQHVRRAVADGADYVGFGSVFKTLTKPERNPMDLKVLQKVLSEKRVPIFFIGGISLDNISQLIDLGATRIAICRDILLAKNPGQHIKTLKQVL